MRYLVLALVLAVAGCKGCCPCPSEPGSPDGAYLRQVFHQE